MGMGRNRYSICIGVCTRSEGELCIIDHALQLLLLQSMQALEEVWLCTSTHGCWPAHLHTCKVVHHGVSSGSQKSSHTGKHLAKYCQLAQMHHKAKLSYIALKVDAESC